MAMKRYIFWIFICSFLFSSQECLAKFHRFSLRTIIGTGYLPLKDWGDFWGEIQSSYYQKDRFGSYWDIGLGYNITEKHALALTVGGISTSASLTGAMFLDLGGDVIGVTHVAEWDFTTTPLSLSYEFYPAGAHQKNSPFFGAGFSYLISELEARSLLIYKSVIGELTQEYTRNGKGYGFHAYLGLQSQITQHLHFISRLRGRYADGMGFTDKKGSIKVEFTGIDITLGIGWTL